MRFLLDTNIVIFVLKDPMGNAAARLKQELANDVVICAMVEAGTPRWLTESARDGRREDDPHAWHGVGFPQFPKRGDNDVSQESSPVVVPLCLGQKLKILPS
jgi:hypothetical protein